MDRALAELIRKNRERIVETWARRIKASIPEYRKRPLEELRRTTGAHLDGLIDVLDRDDYSSLTRFMREIAPMRMSLRFSLSNIQRAFLIGKTVVSNFIEIEYAKDPRRTLDALRAIEEPFHRTLYQYSDLYQGMQIREAEKRSRELVRAEEERRFLERLKAEKAKLDGIMSAIGAGIALFDRNLSVVWANRTVLEMLGDEVEPLELTCRNLYWHKGVGCPQCPTRRCFETGGLERALQEVRDLDGTLRTYQITSTPIRDERGEVQQVLELVQDITDLRELEAELDKQQEFLTAVTSGSADAIIGLDTEDRIVSWNRGAEKIFGYEADEVLGKPLSVLQPAEPQDEDALARIRQQVRERGFARNVETARRAKDGRVVHVDLTWTVLRDRRGRVIGSSVIVRDVSERKKLEKQIIQAERLAAVGRLAARVAHEIRNPLSSISLNVELLGDEIATLDGRDNSEANALLQAISSEVDRLTFLTEEYLQFSRMPELRLEKANLNDVVRELCEFVEQELHSKKISLHLELEETLPEQLLDASQVRRALLNLVRNAIEAMPGGGDLTLRTWREGDSAFVAVRDTGSGIPPEELSRIFDPFHTTKDFGTGLGLSIARQIVREHGGDITCRNVPDGHGAECVIRLPIRTELER